MYAKVVVDISNDAVDRVFTYLAKDDTKIGMRVRVPFGGRNVLGYVISLSKTTDYDTSKIKPIIKNLESVPKIKREMIDLCEFLCEHFFLRMADAIKLVLPSCVRLDSEHEQIAYVLTSIYDLDTAISLIGPRAKSQLSAVAYLNAQVECDYTKMVEMFSRSAINALVDKGIIAKNPIRRMRAPTVDVIKEEKKTLTNYQQHAVDTITNQDKTFLLKGVTGSGKTEVYMQIIENALNEGKTAIMLVPEISLTPQMMQRFTSRFGETVAVLHSGLSEGERFDEWDKIFNGTARVVLGARSAIFAPIENLGAIIIDEEHDGSYVSVTNPRFNTHDVAEFRARYNHCPLVLGSATPSIDSFKRAKEGRYTLVELPERINHREMPKIEIIDMLGEVLDGNTSAYSRKLISKLNECIQNKKQAILFINRRGYASFVMCRECGYRAKCDDCEVSLVYHKEDNQLKCHFCGKRYRMLTNCPNCDSTNIRYGALGTERVCNDLAEMFKDIPIFRMDNDTTRKKNGHKNILSKFASTTPSILVGTQMIAKGHDYPNVAFVGILDADVSLYNSDYKSNERTFQLVTQVSGRAGRADSEGYVVLQTYAPKHYVYRFASNYDYDGFYEKEINLRETTGFPPYSEILRILVSSESDNRAKEVAKKIYDETLKLKEKYAGKIIFLQAMASPIKRIQTKYRYQILTRYIPNDKITKDFYSIADIIEKDVSIFVELNPDNLR